ncbi:class I adenylate-forming enzyme family protein [Streptomyces sp. NBC_01314]|uniref:class I adenylate-forming enzyme family protein n=1 Tax=Streptomyces sp. NBC_01314 TaxID=2903821 RepID=UPI003092FB90|nr:acyl--CoA ligase [Streptomyces sp. NBC_01314]WRZ54377.1 acyl--CoA ligase [Streptomyces sp. NBC_01314]
MIKLEDIRRHAAVRPDADAVVDGATRLSWARFADAVDRFAAGLVSALPDARPLRAVFLCGPRWELTVAMAACATLGIPCTGLDPAQEPDRLLAALELLGPCAVFVSPELEPRLERCAWPGADRALRVVLDGGSGHGAGRTAGAPRTRPDFLALLESEPLRLPAPLHREWLTVVPGGSRPRVAVRAAAAEARALIDLVEEFGFDAHDVHLVAASLWQPLALQLTRTLLAVGATVVLGAMRDPAALAAQLASERVTTAVLDPGVLLALLAHPAPDASVHALGLRCVVTPGTHLGRWAVDAAWERLGPVLHLVHSTPEAGLVSVLTPEESQVTRARSGRAGLGTTVVVLDHAGAVLPAGRPGRIAVRGHQVMDGYLDGEDAFVTLDAGAGRQRFLVTDDLGLLDEQGRLVLTGRGSGVPAAARDGAMDAALFRLESDLLNLPCLRDSAVVRVDLPALGGDALVVPFIAVAVGREVSGHTALKTACARRVPSIPAHVIAVDAIPYSPTGRIRTAELLEAVVPIITLNLQLEQSVHQEISA